MARERESKGGTEVCKPECSYRQNPSHKVYVPVKDSYQI